MLLPQTTNYNELTKWTLNSLALERYKCNLELVIFKLSSEMACWLMPKDLTDD